MTSSRDRGMGDERINIVRTINYRYYGHILLFLTWVVMMYKMA